MAGGPGRRWRLGWLGIDAPWSEDRRARWEIVKLARAASPRLFWVLAVLLVVAAAAIAGTSVVNGYLVGTVVRSPDGGEFALAVAVTAGVYLLSALAPAAATEITVWLTGQVNRDLRLRLLDEMTAPSGIAHLEDAQIKDDVARAGAMVLFTPGAIIQGLADIFVMRAASLASFAIVASFRWWLAVGLPVAYQVIEAQARERYMEVARVVYGQTQDFRRADYVRTVALGGAPKETRVFGMRDWIVDRYRETWLGAMEQVWRDRRRSSVKQAWTGPFQMVTAGLAVWIVARAALDGELDVGGVTVLLGAITGMGGFISYGLHRTRVEYGIAAFGPVLGLGDRIAAHSPRAVTTVSPVPLSVPNDAIRFESVTFRYPGRNESIYDGLDLEIPAGRSLAIVGVNGAGKTTLCKLIARCYEPTAGRITVDGVDLAGLDAAAWQRRVAAVFQDYVGFPLSLADNVAFGAIQRSTDRDALDAAVRDAGLLGTVEALPHGWDSVLDRTMTFGVDLSGGERQRLALARALFAVNAGARVLILDEPTASLDVRGEAELFDRYLDLTRGVTSILVSHRFSTVRRADRICVLDDGRVTESGTHDELLALGGTYATMFTLQASRFTDETETPADA